MTELNSMANIGREMEKKLTSVGIDSAYPQVCLVHLYALEGAIENVEFNALSEDKKRELKELSDFLKR